MVTQANIIRLSKRKPTLWLGFKYYQLRAYYYGFERISLNNYRKFYYN